MGEPDLVAAIAALRQGKAVVVPTDTVYGVAALPTVPGATRQLFALKQRGEDHPLAVLVADLDQALGLIDQPDGDVRSLMDRAWPGPLTLVLRRSPAALHLELGGDDGSIGVRCPDHAQVRELASGGALATTSANRHGEPTPATAEAAAATLAGPAQEIIDGGCCAGAPSTVVDCTVRPWRVLRSGAYPVNLIEGIADGEVPAW